MAQLTKADLLERNARLESENLLLSRYLLDRESGIKPFASESHDLDSDDGSVRIDLYRPDTPEGGYVVVRYLIPDSPRIDVRAYWFETYRAEISRQCESGSLYAESVCLERLGLKRQQLYERLKGEA